MAATRPLLLQLPTHNTNSHVSYSIPQPFTLPNLIKFCGHHASLKQHRISSLTSPLIIPPRASSSSPDKGLVPSTDEDEDGVSLGTMKLPPDVDIARFETLLFQWANSLCQGANLPLPVPLKVDKIEGGARLGFIDVDDGKTEVRVYIDCLVFAATENSGPLFRAIRNGPFKQQAPPGEPRIMRSLLQALQKSIEIAQL
ncbi:uncharacterized protein LOC120275361 [Dioscorea cayenensis subsp. rotundata]|uniref:Uncharacterized protein LOC120275361 n=1 Tax=Dioscorea cayennensis subsp. rotundata TaxID=55577 RepID=A0AB40CHW6_DIOCR|nr:uncharacterized protein LOC120275361 [Dioscorea cayenensis subsp. rotundata]